MGIFRDVGRRGAFILQDDVHRFELHLAQFLDARYALGVANATDGLIIALRAAWVYSPATKSFSACTPWWPRRRHSFCGSHARPGRYADGII